MCVYVNVSLSICFSVSVYVVLGEEENVPPDLKEEERILI